MICPTMIGRDHLLESCVGAERDTWRAVSRRCLAHVPTQDGFLTGVVKASADYLLTGRDALGEAPELYLRV